MRKRTRNDVYANVQRRARAIASILAGDTREETARKLGVTRQTVYNMLKNPRFQDELAMARMALFSRLAYLMGASLAPALQYLRGVVDGSEPPDELRIRAASALLNNSRVFDALAYEELKSQLERLKQNLALARTDEMPIIEAGVEYDSHQTNQRASAGDGKDRRVSDNTEKPDAADVALGLLEQDI